MIGYIVLASVCLVPLASLKPVQKFLHSMYWNGIEKSIRKNQH